MDQPTPKSNISGDGPEGPQRYAAYKPHDIAYSKTFEDDIQTAVLGTPNPSSIAPRISTEDESLPTISQTELPLSLNDTRRVFESSASGHGIRLTHPGGYIHGGPGHAPSDPDVEALARDLIESRDIRDEETLARVLETERGKALDLLKQRMKDRASARESNAQIERELATLSDQMDMELKVLNKARERKMRRQANAE